MRTVAHLVIVAFVATCGSPAPEYAYVSTLGVDTLAVESFRVEPGRIAGVVVQRDPLARVGSYELHLDSAGHIASLEVEWVRARPGEVGRDTASVQFVIEGDSADVELNAMTPSGPIRVPMTDGSLRAAVPGGTVPLLEGGFLWSTVALMRQAVQQLEAGSDQAYDVPVLIPGSEAPFPTALERTGPASAAIDFFGTRVHVESDASSEIVAASGRETTMKFETRRADALDIAALAEEYLAREAAGAGFGVPSPPATVTGTVGMAAVEISYSRPAMRGREIWGALVPFGDVWRTGANAATELTSDRDLLIGEVEIPAGSYTLWSTFTADSAFLIVNSQTGIWGTAHDPALDIARIPLAREVLVAPVERFTIELEDAATGDRSALRLLWDREAFVVGVAQEATSASYRS